MTSPVLNHDASRLLPLPMDSSRPLLSMDAVRPSLLSMDAVRPTLLSMDAGRPSLLSMADGARVVL